MGDRFQVRESRSGGFLVADTESTKEFGYRNVGHDRTDVPLNIPNRNHAEAIAAQLNVTDVEPPKCDWPGHNEAMEEAGFCAVCQEGEVDPEWAARNGFEL